MERLNIILVYAGCTSLVPTCRVSWPEILNNHVAYKTYIQTDQKAHVTKKIENKWESKAGLQKSSYKNVF